MSDTHYDFDLSDAVPRVTGDGDTAPLSTPERVEPETVEAIHRTESIDLGGLIDETIDREHENDVYAALVAFWPDHKGHEVRLWQDDPNAVFLRCQVCDLELRIPIDKYELWFASHMGLIDDQEYRQEKDLKEA